MTQFNSQAHAKSMGKNEAIILIEPYLDTIEKEHLLHQYKRIIKILRDVKIILEQTFPLSAEAIDSISNADEKVKSEIKKVFIGIDGRIGEIEDFCADYIEGAQEGVKSVVEERIEKLNEKINKLEEYQPIGKEGRDKLINDFIQRALTSKVKQLENKLLRENRKIYNIPINYEEGKRETRFKAFTSKEGISEEEINKWHERENKIEINYSHMLEATAKELSEEVNLWKEDKRNKYHLILDVNDPIKSDEEKNKLIDEYKKYKQESEEKAKGIRLKLYKEKIETIRNIEVQNPGSQTEDYEIVKAGIITREEALKIFGYDYHTLTTYSGLLSEDSYKVEQLFDIARKTYEEENKGLAELAEITHEKIFLMIKSCFREALEKKEISFNDIKRKSHRELNFCMSLYKRHLIPIGVTVKSSSKEIEFLNKTSKKELKLEDITDDISSTIINYAYKISLENYAIYKDTGIFLALINRGADFKAKNIFNKTILHHAVENKDLELVDALFDKGANPDIHDLTNNTPLNMAILKGNLDICNLLIKKGANVNYRAPRGLLPLQNAINFEKKEICDLLLENGASIYLLGMPALHYAIQGERVSMAVYFINRGIDLNLLSMYQTTALLHACFLENIALIKLLLSKGATNKLALDKIINLKQMINGVEVTISVSNIETSVLTWAVRNNKTKVVKFLLESAKDLDVNINDKNGDTALIIAIKNKNIELAKELLDKNANPNKANDDGETPLLLACHLQNPSLVKLLLERGADHRIDPTTYLTIIDGTPYETNEQETSVLTMAVRNNRILVVEPLLENIRNLDINMRDKNGNNLVLIALKRGNFEIAKYIVNWAIVRGIDVSNICRETLQVISRTNMKQEVYEFLKAYSAEGIAAPGGTAIPMLQPTTYTTASTKVGNVIPNGKMEIEELEEELFGSVSTTQSYHIPSMALSSPSTSLNNANVSILEVNMHEDSNKRTREENNYDIAFPADKKPRDNGYSR
jgi:ankyrin repeat protein